MSTSILNFGFFLFSLVILIGQWVGVWGLGKANRDAAWWCMIIGICSISLSKLCSGIITGLLNHGLVSLLGGVSASHFFIPQSLTMLGSLLFAIGFAIHGQQASKVHQRITELEAIAAAQSEELNRQRAS